MRTKAMRTLLLMLLGTFLLAAGVITAVWGERPPAELFIGEPNPPEQSYIRPVVGGEITGMPAPVLIVTPAPEPGLLGGVRGRPILITLLGVSILCICALVPLLIIGLGLGIAIRANRQASMVIDAKAEDSPSTPNGEL
jgi:hypothetical protein